jgi:hypothetical protein
MIESATDLYAGNVEACETVTTIAVKFMRWGKRATPRNAAGGKGLNVHPGADLAQERAATPPIIQALPCRCGRITPH